MISFKLANREIKNNYKYWLFFTINLIIGLIGFTFIILFRENVSSALESRSKTLLSSDIVVTGRRELVDKEKENVGKYLVDKTEKHSRLTELYSMATVIVKNSKRTRLIHIKVIKGEYPLIGAIKLNRDEVLNEKLIKRLQDKPYIIVSPEVSHQFKIKKGDEIQLGEKKFELLAVIKSDSTTSMRGINLAPKVYIGQAFLKDTKLISFGTIAWYSDFYTLRPDYGHDKVQSDIQAMIKDPAIAVKTPQNSSEQIGRVINYLSDYLGLIGVVALLISTVGASYLFQSYIFDRLRQIGILKSLGLSRSKIIFSFVLIILFFGFISAFLAIFVSKLLMPFAIEYLNKWMVGDFSSDINLELFTIVSCIGVFINLFVCIPVLIRVFRSKTSTLLNGGMHSTILKIDYLFYLPAVLFLWGISVWQAHSLLVGSVFTLSLLFIFAVVLFVLPRILSFISSRLIGHQISFPFSLSFGYALRLLSRNKIPTILTILCLAIGISLLSVVGQIDTSLKSELTNSSSAKPSLFLFDIQDEQYNDLKQFATDNNYPLLEPTPMIRARLIKKNGIEIKRMKAEDGFSTREEDTKRRFNNRGVNLSYAKGLNSSERLVEGKHFSGNYSGEGLVEISLEKRYAQRMGVSVGDTLTYDVLGVEVQGLIVNLRSVKWTSFQPNFFITLQPGVLEDAPKTFISVVEKVGFEKQLEIQDKIVEKFNNVSILNVTEVITKILSIFSAMAWAINIMSLCCISVGMFVLYSILQSQIHKKKKDLALQKLLGMGAFSVFNTLFTEYMLLGFSSIIIGNSVGLIIALGVSELFLDGVFVFNWNFFIGFNSLFIVFNALIIILSYKNNYKKNIKELMGE